jgi:WD repeat-containing protein 23
MTAPLTKPTRAVRQTDRFSRRSVYDEPTTLNIIKVIQGVSGGWTITDAHLSPDNERFLIFYSVYPFANIQPGLFTPRS